VRAPNSLEQRIDECLPKALRIIQPDEKHIEACKRAVRAAIREIDSDPKTASESRIQKQVKRDLAHIDEVLSEQRDLRATLKALAQRRELASVNAHIAGLSELKAKLQALARRRQKRTTKAAAQKMASVVLAVELMNYNEYPAIGATMKSQHAWLAQLLYEAASGVKGAATGVKGIIKHQVEEYFKKVIAPWMDQVTDKAGRTRSKRRDKIVKMELVDLEEAEDSIKKRPKPD
jgi:hypothetical protein